MGRDERCGRQDEEEKGKVKNPRCKTATWGTRQSQTRTVKNEGCGTRPSVLDEFAQPPESVVPLPGDQIKVAADILEALLIQLPDALSAVPSATHETRVPHDAQVFGDCLTRDVEASGKPRNGRRSAVTETGDQS
jgi:hypothetical protein